MAQHAFGRRAAADIAGADEDDAPGHCSVLVSFRSCATVPVSS
jgi:hypothetical protein